MEDGMKKKDERVTGKRSDAGANDIQEKMRMVDVKTSSPTSLLARNTVLLPSGVVRVKQLHAAATGSDLSSTSSSGSATGNPRNKTALAPGHSLMDWIRLGNSGVDLTGVGGVSQVVSPSELAVHNKRTDAWIAIRGIVFNVTRYMDFHPGGIDELMKGVGKDATKLFENVHAWVNYQSILQKCVVGRLSRGAGNATPTPLSSEKSVNSNKYSLATLGLIRGCTTHSNDGDTSSPLSDITMDWRQTSNSVTFFYKTLREYPGVYYKVEMVNDSKLVFKLVLDKDTVTHELELTANVEWPPIWQRNFDTMEVEFTFTKKVREVWKSQGSHTLSKEVNTNKRIYREYELVSNTPLCKLVHLLVFRSKHYFELIPIGRHVEAKMNVMGMEASRLYTPVPSCLHPENIAPNYTHDCICLMVKRYTDGALSPSITALKPGESLMLSNALGNFLLETYDGYSIVNMLSGGTGLTAMLGIIQRCLARRTVKHINLVNFNRNEDNMFYVEQLDKVTNGNKMKVTHVLSEATDLWAGRRGTISDQVLKETVGDPCPDGCVFTCGPKGFTEAANMCLQKLGWKSSQIYQFDD